MKRLVQVLPGWLQELLPILVGLCVGYFYFMAVIPTARDFGARYLLAFVVIFVITRIPRSWYYGRTLLPPLRRYKESLREGRRQSRSDLEKTYLHLAAFVPRSQMLSGLLWLLAFILLALADQLWMVGSLLSFLGLLFGCLVVSSVSMTLTYFMVKERLRPVLEEVQSQMEAPPRVDRWRVSFRAKMVGFVATLVTLAMLSFGLLLYALMYRSTEAMALSGGLQQMDEFVQRAGAAAPADREAIADHHSSTTWGMFFLGPDGQPQAGCGSTCHGGPESGAGRAARAHLAKLAAAVKAAPGTGRHDREVQTEEGRVLITDLPDGSIAGTVLHPKALADLMRPVLWGGAVYLVVTLTLLVLYILLLGDDQSRVLRRMEVFSGGLASGDLRADVAIWNDDELGRVADNLRGTYYGLRRMVGQAREAAAAVDREVEAAVVATNRLRQDAQEQARSTEGSAQSVAAVAGGMGSVTRSMEAVSGATQDVSSTVLQMHASVEEIASNAETLSGSVEKSVSTTNEIAAASQQVSEAGQRLQEAARESVAFFTELDAALEETRRNAEALLRSAEKVTGDAEEGFSTVAAVEEEILRIRKAAESSRNASSKLRDSMERIGKIVGVIQDVTEQTNLLALNASIIAAGAGEHGRAFSVVASQVRELSGRTAGHAGEIRSVIRSLLESGREITEAIDRTEQVVGASADLSRSAGEALRTILESASSQEDMSRRIAAATEELAHGGQASSRSFHQIFEMAEGIGKATSEQAQATRFLHQESERVRGVAHMLKNATQEQARGARLISEAVSRITADSESTTQAVQTQGEAAASIDAAVRRLAGSARGIGRTVEDLAVATERLQRASEALGTEIRKFEL